MARGEGTPAGDTEAERRAGAAVGAIEEIARRLPTSALRWSVLGAVPVREVYRAAGRRPPGLETSPSAER